MKKDFKKLIRAAESQGWRAKQKKDGVLLLPPDRNQGGVMVHKTYSDRRSYENTLALMRQRGFDG